jgi:hypothetical protein
VVICHRFHPSSDVAEETIPTFWHAAGIARHFVLAVVSVELLEDLGSIGASMPRPQRNLTLVPPTSPPPRACRASSVSLLTTLHGGGCVEEGAA